MKKSFLTKLLALMLLSLTICLSLFGCGKEGDSKSKKKETNGNTMELLSISSLYHRTKSLAKLKVNYVLDDTYQTQSGDVRLLLAKCTVIEDYYEKLESGAEIYLMFSMDLIKDEAAFEEELRNKLVSIDYLFASFSKINDKHFKYTKKGDDEVVKEFSEDYVAGLLEPYDLAYIPIENGSLNYAYIEYLHKQFTTASLLDFYKNYDKYFWDGMSEEKLAENAKKLYSDIKNKTVAGE